MRLLRPLLPCLAVLLLAVSTSSCRSGQAGKTTHTLVILLADGENEHFFQKNYEAFQPDQVRRSNRTLNEYRVIWHCRPARYRRLLRALQADERVLQITGQPPSP